MATLKSLRLIMAGRRTVWNGPGSINELYLLMNSSQSVIIVSAVGFDQTDAR